MISDLKKKMMDEAPSQQELVDTYVGSTEFKSDNTETVYLSTLKRYLKYLEEKRIDKPTEFTTKAYKKELRNKGLSARTLQLVTIVLKRFYSWCLDNDLYPNIAKGLQNERIQKDFKRKSIGLNNAKKLIDFCRKAYMDSPNDLTKLRDYTMIYLMLHIGLRTVEVSRADLSNIKIIDGKNFLFVKGKGHNDPDDAIRLEPKVYKVLERYIEKRKATDGPIFVNHGNRNLKERIKPKVISKIVKAHLRAIGLNDDIYTAHALRHTCAGIAIANGASIQEVQHLLRHKSIETTTIYLREITPENNPSQGYIEKAFNDGEEE
jgi:integrase/recombinase XerD